MIKFYVSCAAVHIIMTKMLRGAASASGAIPGAGTTPGDFAAVAPRLPCLVLNPDFWVLVSDLFCFSAGVWGCPPPFKIFWFFTLKVQLLREVELLNP